MNPTLPRTERLLRGLVASPDTLPGAQVSAFIDGEEVVSLAVGEAGLGRTMTAETPFRAYCALKPVVTVAVAGLVERGLLRWDTPLRPLVPGVRCLDEHDLCLRHLLTHAAGLHTLTGVQFEMTMPEHREPLLRALPVVPGFQIGIDRAYSEVLPWYVLGWLIEALTGEGVGSHVRRQVFEPLGMRRSWMGMTPEEYAAVRGQLGINIDYRDGLPLPYYFEQSERVCCEINPAHGTHSTASDMARFYAAVLAQLGGVAHQSLPRAETLRACCTPNGPALDDPVFHRPCAYGLGFMVNVDHCWWATPSERAFGHVGMFGCAFGFADPPAGLAVGVVLNGVTDAGSTKLREASLLRALYGDLGLAA